MALQPTEHSPLAPEQLIAKIWAERRRFVREGRIKQPHPWRVALSQGKVSRTALIEYVKEPLLFSLQHQSQRCAGYRQLSDS